MRTIKTANGKTIPLVIALIYVRESYKETLQFLSESVRVERMKAFNKLNLDSVGYHSANLYNTLKKGL